MINLTIDDKTNPNTVIKITTNTVINVKGNVVIKQLLVESDDVVITIRGDSLTITKPAQGLFLQNCDNELKAGRFSFNKSNSFTINIQCKEYKTQSQFATQYSNLFSMKLLSDLMEVS